ncbi:M48 family metallopeptidase [Bacillus sp. PS06]|uniref:M48 family metallopeptidase n=1 Tax=Bacillus sp. PS06 TaxID=2764176 RepID=UPI001783260F|nr:SprT family zinc-dependent metalloprotease [Bacillus sp. PS06]MBD8069563.1 M48 family metallopeptidase [Bacillus sp. PS06]
MMHTYLGETINVEIQYKKRGTVGMSIDMYGNLIVQVSKGTTDEQVIHLVERNWELILDKIKEMKARMQGSQDKVYEHGENFLYLGESYPIKIHLDPQISQDHVVFEKSVLHIYVKQHEDDKIKQALKRFYYKQCKALVEKSIRSYQSYFKIKPRSIRITDNNSNWGTCDSKLQLTFNWKLAMAPQQVIDYVVVHEMCHMVHLNHDRSFWRLVGKIMPDYKEQENWLAVSSWKMTV